MFPQTWKGRTLISLWGGMCRAQCTAFWFLLCIVLKRKSDGRTLIFLGRFFWNRAQSREKICLLQNMRGVSIGFHPWKGEIVCFVSVSEKLWQQTHYATTATMRVEGERRRQKAIVNSKAQRDASLPRCDPPCVGELNWKVYRLCRQQLAAFVLVELTGSRAAKLPRGVWLSRLDRHHFFPASQDATGSLIRMHSQVALAQLAVGRAVIGWGEASFGNFRRLCTRCMRESVCLLLVIMDIKCRRRAAAI